MLVWDENHKVDRPTEAEILVRRDRNHPSVVIWSLCNEKLCDRGIPGGVPAFDAAGLIDKHLFEKYDPLMGRVVSANPHDFGNWSNNYTCVTEPSHPCSMLLCFICVSRAAHPHLLTYLLLACLLQDTRVNPNRLDTTKKNDRKL
jgi:hypothetical protein